MMLGIMLFSLAVLFQLITLPVEYNASSRAVAVLEDYGFIDRSERGPVRAVLKCCCAYLCCCHTYGYHAACKAISIAGINRDRR